MIPDIKFLVGSKRFVEALYFGALRLASDPNAELHLNLGLACCGAIRPIAEIQRIMNKKNAEEASTSSGGLSVTRDTLLVYEGLFHLLEARRMQPDILCPEAMRNVIREVVDDLGEYLTQEFHGYQSKYRKHSLKTVAAAAAILLTRLSAEAIELPESIDTDVIDSGNRLLEELTASQVGDASFLDLRL